jgi:hypothetical protein
MRGRVGIFAEFGAAYRIRNNKLYQETMTSVDTVASASLDLLARKPVEEQTRLLAKISELSARLHSATQHETPLVVALTLLVTIRTQKETLSQYAKKIGLDRKS